MQQALLTCLKKGDIFQINKIIEHDRPDFKTGQPIVKNLSTMDDVNTKYANLSTSDKAAISRQERKKVAIYGGELADMEGASIVQACKKFKIPCHIFKYVSDTLEDFENKLFIETSVCILICSTLWIKTIPILKADH